MARDYAKRKPTKKQMAFPFKAAAFLMVLGIVLAAAFWFWRGYQHEVAMRQTLPPVSQAKPVPIVRNVAKEHPVENEEAVQYQFYSMLPNIKVPNPDDSPNQAPGTQSGFWLQIGVYYTEHDAEAMQERAQLLGMEAIIWTRISEQTNKTLFIVAIGPYEERAGAIAKQQELQKLKLDSVIYTVY